MSIRVQQFSTENWEQAIGEQLRGARLAQALDQNQLAARSNVSIGAIRNLELGKGSTVKTLVRVVRALGREDWLATVAPTPAVSPIEVLRNARRPRTRVYRTRRPAATTSSAPNPPSAT